MPYSKTATCWGAVDCGRQTWWFEERPRRVREIRLLFECEGERRTTSARYSFSWWPTAKFRHDLQSWFGRPLTREECAGFNIGVLTMMTATLDLEDINGHRRIVGIRPGFCTRLPHRRATTIILESGKFDPEAFHRLPEAIRDRILSSETYAAMASDGSFPRKHLRAPTIGEITNHDEVPW